MIPVPRLEPFPCWPFVVHGIIVEGSPVFEPKDGLKETELEVVDTLEAAIASYDEGTWRGVQGVEHKPGREWGEKDEERE